MTFCQRWCWNHQKNITSTIFIYLYPHYFLIISLNSNFRYSICASAICAELLLFQYLCLIHNLSYKNISWDQTNLIRFSTNAFIWASLPFKFQNCLGDTHNQNIVYRTLWLTVEYNERFKRVFTLHLVELAPKEQDGTVMMFWAMSWHCILVGVVFHFDCFLKKHYQLMYLDELPSPPTTTHGSLSLAE